MPTVTNISRQACVSKALVSRFLNGDPSLRISKERKKLILEVRNDLLQKEKSCPGFEPKKRLAYNIVIPCFGKEVFDELHAHWESDGLREFRKQLVSKRFRVSITGHEAEEGLKIIKELIDSPGYCDGVLLLRGAINKDIAKLLIKHRFPHVCTDYVGELLGINTVLFTTGNAVHQAVDHLKNLGHRRIGFLGRRHDLYPLYLASMATSHLDIRDNWSCISPKADDMIPETQPGWRGAAYKAFGEWLDRGPTATAMICHNDYGALGAIDAMRERGLEPGRDISLIGFDNFECRDHAIMTDNPIITTFDASLEDLGRRYADILMNQLLHNQRQIVHERIPMHLIKRQSTGRCSEHSAMSDNSTKQESS